MTAPVAFNQRIYLSIVHAKVATDKNIYRLLPEITPGIEKWIVYPGKVKTAV
jgi:hypothetical protein